MTKRLGVFWLALLLSLCLHIFFGWWLHQSARFGKPSTSRAVISVRFLQARLTPAENQLDLQAPSTSPREGHASSVRSGQSLAASRPQTSARRDATSPTAVSESTSVSASDTPVSSVLGGKQQNLPPRLDLNLADAAAATEKQRRQSLLAGVIDAQQMQATASKSVGAVSRLSVVTPNIAEERFTATGGRVIRFSGGDCMRLPNPAARPLGDTRQAGMENC